jgi:hypothetical protein
MAIAGRFAVGTMQQKQQRLAERWKAQRQWQGTLWCYDAARDDAAGSLRE